MRHAASLLIALASISAAAQVPHFSYKGHPVTIVQKTTTTRTLTDGTHLTHVTTETFYRNTQGTYRTDQVFPLGQGRQGSMRLSVILDMDKREAISWNTFDDRPEAGGVSRQSLYEAPPEMQKAATTPQMRVEKLGLGEAGGYPCDRLRYTTTYPAGAKGNDQPYTVVQESCESKDFGTLTQTADDPISGRRVTELISITPGEPDASLFQPPASLPETASR